MSGEGVQPITEQLTIVYEDAEHQRYCELLMEYGFAFEIQPPKMLVGMTFVHPTKNHRVVLDRDDNDDGTGLLEPKLLIFNPGFTKRGTVLFPDKDNFIVPTEVDYSELEWHALSSDKPDDFTMLRRELHIWLKIRPHSLNSQVTLANLR